MGIQPVNLLELFLMDPAQPGITLKKKAENWVYVCLELLTRGISYRIMISTGK